MKKDALVFINHILESIKDIENYSKGLSKSGFFKDKKSQDAIIRKIEIIGEAVKNLPEDFIKKYSNIEWNRIAGTRDKLVHHYFGIDLDMIWEVVKKEIPVLRKQMKYILKNEEGY